MMTSLLCILYDDYVIRRWPIICGRSCKYVFKPNRPKSPFWFGTNQPQTRFRSPNRKISKLDFFKIRNALWNQSEATGSKCSLNRPEPVFKPVQTKMIILPFSHICTVIPCLARDKGFETRSANQK